MQQHAVGGYHRGREYHGTDWKIQFKVCQFILFTTRLFAGKKNFAVEYFVGKVLDLRTQKTGSH